MLWTCNPIAYIYASSSSKFFAVPQMLALMVDLDDEAEALAEWSVTDEAEEDDCDANTVAGENALDRFACAVGGKTMLPHIMATVPTMLQNREFILLIWMHIKLGENE